ncbi:hypothetical protein J1605_004666 [Eschrichtius robustus]|uniref:Vasohibin-2 n=1 Tax=Eschrichtius robustus TaxID=9764 RepID=A0AB34HFF0_ESCRO|nr:hypothetical protein J1605_004666 [Eschrichtius robustus]
MYQILASIDHSGHCVEGLSRDFEVDLRMWCLLSVVAACGVSGRSYLTLHHVGLLGPNRVNDSVRYLTNGQPSIERFPISFKTYFSGNYFHHVVLGIYCNGRYGSLGMSRRAELMDKPLTFRTLSDLIFDFEDSYKKYLHTVKKVKIGLYVPHEPHSFQPIEWKQLVLNVSKMLRADIRKELEKYARDMRMKILKPASAHSPTQVRSRGKSLSPRRRQASPPRRLGRRDKS